MCVDVEVRVRYKAEIVVLLAMEVEGNAITTNETRVLAHCSWSITPANRLASGTINLTSTRACTGTHMLSVVTSGVVLVFTPGCLG